MIEDLNGYEFSDCNCNDSEFINPIFCVLSFGNTKNEIDSFAIKLAKAFFGEGYTFKISSNYIVNETPQINLEEGKDTRYSARITVIVSSVENESE